MVDRRKRYTEEQIHNVIKLINEGKNIYEICGTVGVKRNLVIDLRRGKHRPELYDTIEPDKRLKAKLSSHSIAEPELEIEINPDNAYKYLKAGNIYKLARKGGEFLVVGICKVKVNKVWEDGVVYKKITNDEKFDKKKHMNLEGKIYCLDKFSFIELMFNSFL